MALNLQDMVKNGGIQLQTKNDKLVMKLTYDEIVNGIIKGMSNQARSQVTVRKVQDGIEFEFDVSLLSQAQTLFKP